MTVLEREILNDESTRDRTFFVSSFRPHERASSPPDQRHGRSAIFHITSSIKMSLMASCGKLCEDPRTKNTRRTFPRARNRRERYGIDPQRGPGYVQSGGKTRSSSNILDRDPSPRETSLRDAFHAAGDAQTKYEIHGSLTKNPRRTPFAHPPSPSESVLGVNGPVSSFQTRRRRDAFNT